MRATGILEKRLGILLYPNRSNKRNKAEKQLDGIDSYTREIYHTIFKKNNTKLREKFFKDDFLRQLWEIAVPDMTEKISFPEGINFDNLKGYSKITYVMMREGFTVPQFWKKHFPPLKYEGY